MTFEDADLPDQPENGTQPTRPTDVAPPIQDGTGVAEQFAAAILGIARDRLTLQGSRAEFTAEDLIGPDFWPKLSHGERRRAGLLLARAAERGQVHMVRVSLEREYPARYVRTDI